MCIDLIFFALGIAVIYAYKKSIKFNSLMLIKTCSGFFLSVICPFAFLYYVFPIGGFVPLLFAASSFFAIGLVGVYGDRKYRKLGFCYLTTSLLFLIGAPFVNFYKINVIDKLREINSVTAVYREYTLPFILVSIAFFILGCTLILYRKFQTTTKQNLDDVKIAEQEKIKRDSTCNNQRETNGVKRSTINFKSLGFSFMVFSPLILIWAAIIYRSAGVWRGTVPVVGNLVDCALPVGLIGVALFALGFGLMLYKKSARLRFFLVASGSVVLIIAGFAYIHEIEFTELVFGYVPLRHHINPYRDFTLPLILASLVPLILGYISMLNKSLKKNTLRLFR
ncbi:MAG: hypothetical protein PVH73_01380 [Candidatus Bathyarchaeota archaeon]|jgi:hypothetical protein